MFQTLLRKIPKSGHMDKKLFEIKLFQQDEKLKPGLSNIFNILKLLSYSLHYRECYFPIDTGRKLNVHKTCRRRPGRLRNVLCTLNLRPVSTGLYQNT